MPQHELICVIDTEEDLEAARISINQAVIRSGLDAATRIDSLSRTNPNGYGYLFSTIGLTDAEHVARLRECEDREWR